MSCLLITLQESMLQRDKVSISKVWITKNDLHRQGIEITMEVEVSFVLLDVYMTIKEYFHIYIYICILLIKKAGSERKVRK